MGWNYKLMCAAAAMAVIVALVVGSVTYPQTPTSPVITNGSRGLTPTPMTPNNVTDIPYPTMWSANPPDAGAHRLAPPRTTIINGSHDVPTEYEETRGHYRIHYNTTVSPTPSPSPVPKNITKMMNVTGAWGPRELLVAVIDHDTPAAFAPLVYGYDNSGDSFFYPWDVPALINASLPYFSHQGYYNLSTKRFIYYFKNNEIETLALPTASPNQTQMRQLQLYSLTGEVRQFQGNWYGKDNEGLWIKLGEVDAYGNFQAYEFIQVDIIPTNASGVNVDWRNSL
jgi:hypothetical protein